MFFVKKYVSLAFSLLKRVWWFLPTVPPTWEEEKVPRRI